MKLILTALLAFAPLTAHAQTVEPARVEAAKSLLDTMMPPARRGAMIDQLVAVSNANITRGLSANAAFTKALSDDPRAAPIFQRFLANQQAEIRTFFASPTGQAYLDRGSKIMTDPDVSARQQKMVSQQMSKMPNATRALAAEIMALPRKEGK